MTFDISLWDVIKTVLGILVTIGTAAAGWWMKRIQADKLQTENRVSNIQEEVTKLRLDMVTNFARRDEVKESRHEVMAALKDLDRKVDRIFHRLDDKADKPK